jgi:Na+-translocating ferredoxin:NAD+ oxidoreductase RnfG subunit
MFAKSDHQDQPLKPASISLSPKSWLRMAVLALTVGLITIVSGQLSLVYAQNGKQSPSKAQNSKKSADKKMAPHKAQKAQSAAARIKHTAQGSTTRNQTLAKAGRNAKQLYGGDALWYVLAVDKNGKRYKGLAFVETEPGPGMGK